MTASLYQRLEALGGPATPGSAAEGATAAAARTVRTRFRARMDRARSGLTGDASCVDLEVRLGPDARPDPEHVGGDPLRVELDEVVRALPQVPGVGQQVVDLIGLMLGQPEVRQR